MTYFQGTSAMKRHVPLDIGKYGVTMAHWWTCDVLLVNISSHGGLLEMCSDLGGGGQGPVTGPPTYVLCYVMWTYTFGRRVTYASLSTASFFAKTPLLFGMWHAYKFFLTECYRRFLPLWAALECKPFLTDPANVEILTNFNVSMMESMVWARD